jgi:thiol-disulfide isomerase/thioredoxin
MSKLALAVAASIALFAVDAVGEGESLVGRPAPEIKTTEWLHGDGRTSLADFRGHVVLLEFWSTTCDACRGDTRHLAKLAETYGKKGLEVVALTGEDDRRALTKYLTFVDPAPNYRLAVGYGSGYAITRLPCAVLIDPDGKVLLDGTGGRSFSNKEIEAALKTVRQPTAEELEARAAKRLAFAESFAKERLYARAEYEMLQAAKLHPGTASGKKAEARAKSFDEGEAAAERDAQWVVAKIVGLNPTFEHPLDKPSRSEAEALSKRLIKKADEIRSKAPRAAKMALEWSDFFDAVVAGR